MSNFLTIHNKNIYYEIHGEAHLPVYLYLHGGPGAGSYDFIKHQAQRLSECMQIIAIDQRGVLRSDPIEENESFGLVDLIYDFEAIREQLGINKWGIIGHSFGGYLAVLYQLTHPNRVEKLILECPMFDFKSSARSLIIGAIQEYKQLGENQIADEFLKAIQISDTEVIWWKCIEALRGLGSHKDNLYVYGKEKHFFDSLVETSGIPQENWNRAGSHQQKLYEEGKVFESLLPKLDSVNCSILLIKGKYDWVTSDDQLRIFDNGQSNRKIFIFDASGHFPRFEEPERYAQTIKDFIN